MLWENDCIWYQSTCSHKYRKVSLLYTLPWVHSDWCPGHRHCRCLRCPVVTRCRPGRPGWLLRGLGWHSGRMAANTKHHRAPSQWNATDVSPGSAQCNTTPKMSLSTAIWHHSALKWAGPARLRLKDGLPLSGTKLRGVLNYWRVRKYASLTW